MLKKLKNASNLVLVMGFLVTLTCVIGWSLPSAHVTTTQTEAACDEIQHAYADVLYRVWIDNPSYVEDVLVECDEWCDLYELMGDDWMNYKFKSLEDSLAYENNLTGSIVYDPTCINWVYIPDSTYRKLRQVFPDLPAEQDRPDKRLKKVNPININN